MKNRNTLCIYDSTVKGGSLAAAIVKKFWIEENKDMPNNAGEMIMAVGDKIASFYGTITFKEWKSGDKLPELFAYDKVILLGITFPEDVMSGLYNSLKRDFVWIENRRDELYKMHNTKYGGDPLLQKIIGLRGDMHTIDQLTWIMYSVWGLQEAPDIIGNAEENKHYDEYYKIIK